MKYTKLGNSDMNISRICLGCLSFGVAAREGNNPWLLNQETTDEIFGKALDMGVNFFDTANYYNGGTSEIYLGNAVKKLAKREDIYIATKVFYNEGALSREAILREVDASLKRLQTDYIDLYIIHRWDYSHPIAETMEALHDVIGAGKVRHIGASAMYAYQFLKAQETARQHGWTPFISMQDHYNLIYREDERELFPLLREENVHITPYSPLAAGRLARLWDSESLRSKGDAFHKKVYDANKEIDYPIVERVHKTAEKYGVPMSQIALAWLLSKDVLAAPVVGVSKMKHLEDAVVAVDLKLEEEDIMYLEELYVPHKVQGAL